MLLKKTSPTLSSDFDRPDLRIGVQTKKQCVKHTTIISQEPVFLQAPKNNILVRAIKRVFSTPARVEPEAVFLPKMKEKPRVKGNRCGHDPKNLRFFKEPPNQGRRFHVLEEGKRRVKNAFDNPFDYPMFHGLLFHQYKNGKKSRRIRSERKESSFLLVMPAIFNSVNLVTMELGHFNGTEFINYDYGHLTNKTETTYSRMKEAMSLLKNAGLVEVKSVIKIRDDGAIRTERVVIKVSDKLFDLFGLSEELQRDRQRALLAHAKKEKEAQQKKACLALFKPKGGKEEKKREAAICSVKALTTHFKIVKNTPKAMPSSPLSHPAVRELAHTLFLSGDYPTLMSAAIEACRRLNKPPPINSS